MGSGTLTTATIFVWMLNILMIFSQLAINDMTVNTPTTVVNYQDTIFNSYSTSGNISSLSGPSTQNLTSELPGGAVPNSGFYMVDWITSMTSWFGKQVNMITQVVNAPYNMLMSIPLFQNPRYSIFAIMIGLAWWGISLLLIIAFTFGR